VLRRTINGRVVRDQPECSRNGPRFDCDGGDITDARKVADDGRRRAGVMMRRGLTLESRRDIRGTSPNLAGRPFPEQLSDLDVSRTLSRITSLSTMTALIALPTLLVGVTFV